MILYICNILSDNEMKSRTIKWCSTAAFHKVLGVSTAIANSGLTCKVVSLAFGRQSDLKKINKSNSQVLNNIPIHYLNSIGLPLFKNIFASIILLIYLIKNRIKFTRVIFYNARIELLLGIVCVRLMGKKCYLDVEDYPTCDDSFINRISFAICKNLCNSGVLTVSKYNEQRIRSKNMLSIYGVYTKVLSPRKIYDTVNILVSGTLESDTGADLVYEMVSNYDKLFSKLSNGITPVFHISGSGSFMSKFKELSNTVPNIFIVYGNLSNTQYSDLIKNCHIGLSLKIPNSIIGDTTFPSKTIEYVKNGLCLVTTRVSDVPLLFNNNSCVFVEPDVNSLSENLVRLVNSPSQIENIANSAQEHLNNEVSLEAISVKLNKFFRYFD